MSDGARLNERFGIEGELTFRVGGHGALFADVTNAQGRGSIALQGAQVLDWVPLGREPVVWLSEDAGFKAGKSLRGGVPVCWPWFGPHPDDPQKPAHGFARNLDWEVTEAAGVSEGTRIRLRFIPGEAEHALWPHEAELSLVVVMGERLLLELETRNLGTDPIGLTQALHTYFRVGDIASVQVEGLEGCEYIDKVGEQARRRQEGLLVIPGEVDRIYLDCPGDAVIVDRALERRIRISKQGSNSYVVWNPWEETGRTLGDMGEDGYRTMLCVETTNAGSDTVVVEPGDTYRLVAEYAVESL